MSTSVGPSSMSRSKQSKDEAVTIALHNLVAVAFNASTINLEEAGDLAKTLTEPSSYADAMDTAVLHNQVRALLDVSSQVA